MQEEKYMKFDGLITSKTQKREKKVVHNNNNNNNMLMLQSHKSHFFNTAPHSNITTHWCDIERILQFFNSFGFIR